MTVPARARAYCEAIGKDPDEPVDLWYGKQRHVMPRWQALLGADPSLAAGAMELSPTQLALARTETRVLGYAPHGGLGMHAEGRRLMERGIAKAAHRQLNPEAKAECWFFLSFVDPDRPPGERFLGCTVVVADDFAEAIAASHLLKINPGGEVQGHGIEDDGTLDRTALEFMLNRLRTKAEVEAAGLI